MSIDQNANSKTMRVIIVDAANRYSTELLKLLQLLGHELTIVASTIEAFAAYQVIHPDLMLVCFDANSTNDSKQMCRNIRELESARHTGIIFITLEAQLSDALVVELLETGADDVLRAQVSEREVLARANAVLKLKAMTDELRSANHRLRQLSLTDDLTGLANMRAFNGRFSKVIGDCFAGRTGVGVIMLDLDYFKNVNDSSNHLMGSHVIAEVGKILRFSEALEGRDCAARFGGDEYVIFTVDDNLETVRHKGEAIRLAIEKTVFTKDGHSCKITASVGVSWTKPNYRGKAEDPIKAADLMLYQSKHDGRNRVTVIELLEEEQLRALDKVS